jgi:hypothetical protein
VQGSRSLLATPRGITLRRVGRPIHIPWQDIADFAVVDIMRRRGHSVRQLWITLRATSPHYTRLKRAWLEKLLSAALPMPPPGSVHADTADHDPDEVLRKLKALYAEYVRGGVVLDAGAGFRRD